MKQQVTLSALTLSLLTASFLTSASQQGATAQFQVLSGVDKFNAAPLQVVDIKKQVAKNVALSLSGVNTQLQLQLNQYQDTVSLEQVAVSTQTQRLVAEANQYTRQLKGLSDNNSNLYQLRLADNEMLTAWQQGQMPLIAFAPKGDDKDWQYVEAYDHRGSCICSMPTHCHSAQC